MALKLAEGLVDRLVTMLGAGMTAKLAALDAEYTDSIVLAPPAAYVIAEQKLEDVAAWPVMYVLVDDTTLDRWGPSFTDSTHRVLIGALVLDQVTDDLKRRLYRYARAIWEVLLAGQLVAANGYQIIGETPRFDFSPIFTNDRRSEFASDVTVRVQLRAVPIETV